MRSSRSAKGFALYDKDDCLVLANSRYRKMHAISADVLVPGVNWFDFLRVTAERKQFPVPAGKIDEWLAERAKDRREFRQQEFQHTSGDWFFVSNCPTREGGFVVTRLDITERKRAELAAKEADEMVRKVLEACPVNIQMTRAEDGKLLYRSPARRNCSARPPAPSTITSTRRTGRNTSSGCCETGRSTISRPSSSARTANRAGARCPSRLIDFHGEKVIVSHTYDLTDHIEMQQELEHQRETLHQNEKMSALGGLLAGVAHELNNPLSVVLGLSLMMKESGDRRQDRRARRQDQQGGRTLRPHRQDLPGDGAAATGADVERHGRRGHRFGASRWPAIPSARPTSSCRSDLEPDLPAIWADPDQLSQVWINLLVNAEQALHDWDGQRKIVVSTRLHPDSGSVVVRVADTGPGIPKEILPRIFEPFFTTKEVGAGTGIGLSFCHRIVQSHGGTIQVETSEGGGSAFVVSLAGVRAGSTSATEIAVEEDCRSSAGLACLVIDDEEEVGELIADVLRRDGFRVIVAGSGKEALRQLKKQTLRADPQRPEDAEHGWAPPVQPHFRIPSGRGRQTCLPDRRYDQPGCAGFPARDEAALSREAGEAGRSQDFRLKAGQQGSLNAMHIDSTPHSDSSILEVVLAERNIWPPAHTSLSATTNRKSATRSRNICKAMAITVTPAEAALPCASSSKHSTSTR